MQLSEVKDLFSRIIEANPENEIGAIIDELVTIPAVKEHLQSEDKISLEERIKLIRFLTKLIDEKTAKFDTVLENPRFTDYRDDYYRNIRAYKISSQESLWQAVDNAGIISVADFHFVHEPRFFLLMVLRHLLETNSRVTVCLEPVLLAEQRLLEDYLSRRNHHNRFARSAEVYSKDPVAFELDRVIYEFIKENHDRIRTIGTDTKGSLSDRDRHAAVLVAREKERNPEVPVVVFAGDLHFAPSHLPAEISRRTDASQVVIYQNIPKIYYDLLRRGLVSEGSVVRCSRNSFCVTSLSPLELAVAHLDYKNQTPEDIDSTNRSYHENAADILRVTKALTRVPLKRVVMYVKELYQGTRVLKEAERDAA